MANTVSNFDTNDEGWVIGNINSPVAVGGTQAATYNAAGGNPGGYISTNDVFDITGFIAPSSYTGNQSANLGGTLTFSLQDLVTPDNVAYPTVVIYSGGSSIAYAASLLTTAWTTFSVPLSSTGWTVYPGGEANGATPVSAATFATIMANITSLAIEADWHTGADITGLDSVAMTAAQVATTPIPAALPLFASALGGLGFAGWRRRRAAQASV